jgi:hypothetical protein
MTAILNNILLMPFATKWMTFKQYFIEYTFQPEQKS